MGKDIMEGIMLTLSYIVKASKLRIRTIKLQDWICVQLTLLAPYFMGNTSMVAFYVYSVIRMAFHLID